MNWSKNWLIPSLFFQYLVMELLQETPFIVALQHK